MRAGRLRHRVTFQERSVTLDAAGALAPGWVDVLTCWAEVRSVAGIERVAVEVEQARATLTHQITIRRPGLALRPSNRVLWKGRIFEIVSVLDPDNRGEFQRLACYEIVEPVPA